jgi:hypothetical protein
MPLTFLDHRLVVGDSLTGPFWEKLIFRPGKPSEPIENLFNQRLYEKLTRGLCKALSLVRRLEATTGITIAEMREKELVKAELDGAMLPFRIAAAAWAGGVMLGPEKCDDVAYAGLLKSIGETGDLPHEIESTSLCETVARGLGLDALPAQREAIYTSVQSGQCVPALPYDLTFPEVFYPAGQPHGRRGFHAVLGNPPWDAIQFKSREFFAAFDFEILNAAIKREREGIERRLTANPVSGHLYKRHKEDFEQQKRANDAIYSHQKVFIDGDLAGRYLDSFRIFMERNAQFLGKRGWTGVVVPCAFHANEGATGVRRLYLETLSLHHCYSFENRRKLFDIHSSFKFATVVAQADRHTEEFSCAFYLHDDEWLFGRDSGNQRLLYTPGLVRRTSGEYLSFLELRSSHDLAVAQTCFESGVPFGKVCEGLTIKFGQELNMTLDAWRFEQISKVLPDGGDPRDPRIAARLLETGYLVLHEGKTFWQYAEPAHQVVRYLVPVRKIDDRPTLLTSARYYRIGHREVQNAGNVRTVIMTVFAPGITTGHTVTIEITPQQRSYVSAMALLSITNSFAFDMLMRVRSTAHVTKFLMNNSPIPTELLHSRAPFLARSSLRLTCNHAGYAALSKEQLGDVWREPGKPPMHWPVLAGDEERWAVRAAIDAVVADAYGLSRDQYGHVLSTFKHTSYAKAPDLCLARFDELKSIGLEAFTKKHDPYWNIPLNENLPQPVIDLPGLQQPGEEEGFKLDESGGKPKRKGRARK